MPKIDVTTVPARQGSGYPNPFDAPCSARTRRRLGEAGGLRDFGVNLMTPPQGGWSSQRHWHSDKDEFVYLLEGEVTLVEDGGETLMRAGDCAAFPKGSGNATTSSIGPPRSPSTWKWARAIRTTSPPAPTST